MSSFRWYIYSLLHYKFSKPRFQISKVKLYRFAQCIFDRRVNKFSVGHANDTIIIIIIIITRLIIIIIMRAG
jgi:hypothetical protein